MRAARASAKSVDAFRTISEVSAHLDVPQHVLRFWESKFPQVRPLKRGGGRRYYRPEDVTLLGRIRALLYDEGYTIRGVQRLLKERKVPLKGDGPGIDGRGVDGAVREPGAGAVARAPTGPAAGPVTGPDRQALGEIIEELEGLRDRLRAASGRR